MKDNVRWEEVSPQGGCLAVCKGMDGQNTFKLAVAAARIAPRRPGKGRRPRERPEPRRGQSSDRTLPAGRDWPPTNYEREHRLDRGEDPASAKRPSLKRGDLDRRISADDEPALVLSTLTAHVVAGGASTPRRARTWS